MKRVRQVLAWIYGAQVFLVAPWVLGDMWRGDLSVWAWQGFTHETGRHGVGNGVLLLYMYLIFYSAFITIPYLLLSWRYRSLSPRPSTRTKMRDLLPVASWFLFTFLLFLKPILAFLGALDSEGWRGWLLIFWLAFTAGVVILVVNLEKERSETTRKNN